MCGLTEIRGAVRAPATPARAAPMNIAIRAVWLIEIPCSAAASGSWALARSAQPKRVFFRNAQRLARRSTAARITASLKTGSLTFSLMTMTSWVTGGTCSMRTPNPMDTNACRIIRKPIEATSPPSGLSRSGRKNARSMPRPTMPTKIIPTATATRYGRFQSA